MDMLPCWYRLGVYWEAVSEQEVVTARRNKGEFKMELTRNID
jgi:hypothetical protein